MQIEKNIAAMLQSKMKETGKTKLEFSKELGIPRSTLQGYLKGDKCLRSDSIEEIAKRLDLSPAQLISGPAYAEEFGLFSMDALQEELRMLHPQAQGLAREAVALLHAAFRLSAEWNRLDVHPTAARTEDSEGLTYRHIPYEAHGEARMLYAYGILVQKYLQTHWTTIFFVVPFSNDRPGVTRLAKLCTEQQLDPIHLFDVIHDFMNTETRSFRRFAPAGQRLCIRMGRRAENRAAPFGGQPCAGKDQAVVFATFSTKRWRMAATCALVALPVGRRRPSEPLTSFSAKAQLSGALA